MGGTAVRGARHATTDTDDFSGMYGPALVGLVRYFRGKGLGAEDANDLAHETLLRILVHLKRHGRTRTDLGPLTKTIARNLLVERRRKATPYLVPLSDAVHVADDAPEPADRALAQERRDAVRIALSSLAPRHRRVVELWMSGRTPAEIAGILGIKRNAADAILHRARRALASKLGPRALWGLIGLAVLRARTSIRDAAQNVPAWSPTAAAAAPVGVSLVVLGLAAVLSVGPRSDPTPPATSSAKVGGAHVTRIAERAETAKPGQAASTLSSSRSSVTRPPNSEVAIGVGGAADEEDPIVVGVTLRPDEEGDRGTVGPLLEGLMNDTCGNVKAACGGRR